MNKIDISTSKRSEMIDITGEIEEFVKKSKVKDGVCAVFNPHTTAGLTINENADPSVKKDILQALDKIVPWDDDYSHSEGNAAAHVKASLMGSSLQILIEDGSLVLGTWQGICFCEFDGPRKRDVYVKILPG
jgi:secondary thiamine-phosphate synthase enzyme